MARTFGIELEVVGKRGRQVGLWGRITTALTAAGISHATAGYSGADYTRWQVKPDSSVSCNGTPGAEVVSPVLPATEAGFAEAARVCRVVEASGATANKTCGMHVHVDVRDLTVEQLKNVLRAYGTFQAEIDSVLPASRRGSRWAAPLWNNYTRSSMLTRIETAATVRDLAYAIGTRYSVCNLQKFTRTGTLEFRQHSGTAEARKADAWARWCVAFVETFKDINVMAPAPTAGDRNVLRTLAGRGQRKNPSRGISRALVRAMTSATPSASHLQDVIHAHGGSYTVEQWMQQLSSRYGWTVQELDVAGVRCWQIATEGATELPAEPFARCFTPGGNLAYFGARRAALA